MISRASDGMISRLDDCVRFWLLAETATAVVAAAAAAVAAASLFFLSSLACAPRGAYCIRPPFELVARSTPGRAIAMNDKFVVSTWETRGWRRDAPGKNAYGGPIVALGERHKAV